MNDLRTCDDIALVHWMLFDVKYISFPGFSTDSTAPVIIKWFMWTEFCSLASRHQNWRFKFQMGDWEKVSIFCRLTLLKSTPPTTTPATMSSIPPTTTTLSTKTPTTHHHSHNHPQHCTVLTSKHCPWFSCFDFKLFNLFLEHLVNTSESEYNGCVSQRQDNKVLAYFPTHYQRKGFNEGNTNLLWIHCTVVAQRIHFTCLHLYWKHSVSNIRSWTQIIQECTFTIPPSQRTQESLLFVTG